MYWERVSRHLTYIVIIIITVGPQVRKKPFADGFFFAIPFKKWVALIWDTPFTKWVVLMSKRQIEIHF